MNDFVPADLITFDIKYRSLEEFHEYIDTVPSIIRGAYFVSSNDDYLIYNWLFSKEESPKIFKSLIKQIQEGMHR